METFAYLHAAQEYEYPENRELHLPSRAMLMLLGFTSTLGILNLSQAAQALTLLREDSGADVTRLQDLLRDAGYFPRSSTGYFGEVTEAAVKDLQRTKGLMIDGVAGDRTLKALETPCPPTPPCPPVVTTPPITPPITPPVTPPVTPSSGTLGFGDTGAGVTRLQDLLRRAGYFDGLSTGYFGSYTKEKLVLFQKENRLTADGFASRATIAALEKAPAAPAATASKPPSTTAPAVTPVALTRMLMMGDIGNDVRSLQQKLTALKYYTGPITGEFGNLTEAAILNFQRDKNLGIDGVVGSRTATLLR
jgi:peptidoglycan hydrolase-like protein with peptidoglycan-binding domain